MKMELEHRRALEELAKGMKCPKGFECIKADFEQSGKVRLLAKGRVVECLEQNGRACKFGLIYGDGVFCECPLRQYIAKNFPTPTSTTGNVAAPLRYWHASKTPNLGYGHVRG